MEIADHAGGAQPHLPVDYQPLTLTSLLRQKGRLPCQSLVREPLVRESLLAPTLAGIPSRAPAPTPLGVVECALALLDAIEHLHKSGLQHRDIKPANVLFVGGVLKLADMGLTASDDADETVGTPGYLPPPEPLQDACGTGLPTGHSGADATNDRPQGVDVPERRPRGADATPPAAGSPPGRPFGRPDDLYALGKVMYEMLTGLPAAAFPEWPADLDPASDPLLPQLRKLINELCHPDAELRLSDLRMVRQRLANIATGPHMLRITRRRAWVAVAMFATAAACAGVVVFVGLEWLADPYNYLLGDADADGTTSEQRYVSEAHRYSLWREHRPGERKCAGLVDRTSLCVWDLQTTLGPAVDDEITAHPEKMDDCLIVAGTYQIQDRLNPVTGDARNPRGKFDQLYLVVGDGPGASMHLLYHGQPGAPPGVRGRFVWRVPLRKLRPGQGGTWLIRLVCIDALTPAQAELHFKKWGDESVYCAISLGWVTLGSHVDDQPAAPDSQTSQ